MLEVVLCVCHGVNALNDELEGVDDIMAFQLVVSVRPGDAFDKDASLNAHGIVCQLLRAMELHGQNRLVEVHH